MGPTQRPLPDNTQHSQQTVIHARGGVRNLHPSKRAAADTRLRPRGRWNHTCSHLLISEAYCSYWTEGAGSAPSAQEKRDHCRVHASCTKITGRQKLWKRFERLFVVFHIQWTSAVMAVTGLWRHVVWEKFILTVDKLQPDYTVSHLWRFYCLIASVCCRTASSLRLLASGNEDEDTCLEMNNGVKFLYVPHDVG